MKAKVKVSGRIIHVMESLAGAYVECAAAPDGKIFQLRNFYTENELEFLPDTPEEVVIEGYVVRDEYGDLALYEDCPEKNNVLGLWEGDSDYFYLPDNSFPSITWESEPKRVKITITPIEE